MIRGLNEEFGYHCNLSRFTRAKLRVGVMTEGVVVNDGDLITLPQQKTLELQRRFHEI
jgi:pyruvate kinase